MTEPFIGQITHYGFDYPPYQWALCNGATLLVQQNTALFALIANRYGGNGTTNYMLPNFAGQAVCGPGTGPGLSPRDIGDVFGSDTVALGIAEMPRHTHDVNFYAQNQASKRTAMPANGSLLTVPQINTTAPFVAGTTPSNTSLSPQMLQPAGSSQPHENRQPYLSVNFSIALYGVFPAFQ